MRVSDLELVDFRSYSSTVLSLPPGVVALLGKNGRGKTNLVEAIAYVSALSSHRGAPTANLVRVGTGADSPGGAVVRARVEAQGRSSLIELEIARGRANRARLNRAKVRPRDVLGQLRAVVFAPEDLELLRGEPSLRRSFLDQISVQLKPHYLGVLRDFQKVQRQRAAHLKDLQRKFTPSQSDLEILSIWDDQLALLSATVAAHRSAVVESLQPLVSDAYASLTDSDRRASLSYVSHLGQDVSVSDLSIVDGRFEGSGQEGIAALKRAYDEQIEQRRGAEIARGVNLVGAQRDDFQFFLDALPVKGFASHGEMWSSVLTLRLSEAELLKQEENTPVLVLDDVFAELDETRRAGLIAGIRPYEQVFVTSAVESDIPQELDATVFKVVRGDDGLTTVSGPTKVGAPADG